MRGRYQRRRTASHRRCLIASLLVLSAQSATAQGPVVLAPLPLQPQVSDAATVTQPNPFCLPPEAVAAELTDTSTGNVRVTQNPSRALVKRDAGIIPLQVIPPKTNQAGGYSVSLAWTNRAAVENTGEVRQPLDSAASGASQTETPGDFEELESSSETQPAYAEDALDLSFSEVVPTETVEDVQTISPPTAEPVVGVAIEPLLDEGRPEKSKLAWKGEEPVISITDLPQPVLTRVPISSRIIPVPVPAETPAEPASEAHESSGPATRDLGYAERRIVNGVHPKVDVSKPPVAVERFARFGAGWLANAPSQSGDLLVKAGSSVQPAAAAADHLTDSLPKHPELVVETPEPLPSSLPLPTLSDTDPASPVAVEAQPEVAAAEAVQVIGQIRLKPSEVRSIRVAGNIRKIESDTPATCTAFLTKAGQVQLIATGAGLATLTVELTETPNVTRKVAYEVQVDETATSAAQSLDLLATKLSETLRLAFPQANARVRSHAGRLEIIGDCPDEQTAKQILRMVRSACPMAINDRLNVR
jgi:hypothetical protein